MTAIIHVGGQPLVDVLTNHGWVQSVYDDPDGGVCLHGAIRRCQPVPGDAAIIETVEGELRRWSTEWNDDKDRTRSEVLDLAAAGWDITDTDLATVFGPQWKAVIAIVRRAAVLSANEVARLADALNATMNATRTATRDAARDAAWNARDAAWNAARDAVRITTWDAATDAAWNAARNATRDAALYTALYTAIAVVTWDLATDDGPYTTAHRDLLIGPWRQVVGEPTDLIGAP